MWFCAGVTRVGYVGVWMHHWQIPYLMIIYRCYRFATKGDTMRPNEDLHYLSRLSWGGTRGRIFLRIVKESSYSCFLICHQKPVTTGLFCWSLHWLWNEVFPWTKLGVPVRRQVYYSVHREDEIISTTLIIILIFILISTVSREALLVMFPVARDLWGMLNYSLLTFSY